MNTKNTKSDAPWPDGHGIYIFGAPTPPSGGRHSDASPAELRRDWRRSNIFKYFRPCFFVALAVLFFAVPAFAKTTVTKTVLENGMTVLAEKISGSPIVALQALVKTGSATEGQYLGSGISHFVEHMLFKGTEKRGVGQISKEVKALGGYVNASTSFDYTMYTIEVPMESFSQALDVLADMLMSSKFDPAETEREREVILGEIRLYLDNPDRRLSQLVFSNVYTRHPYRHPIIGYEPLFKTITRDELVDYYKRTYIPNNIVFSVAGDVDNDGVISEISRVFENFKPQPYLLRNLPQEPVQLSRRKYSEDYQTQLTRLSIAYQGIALTDRDLFAMDVLAMILGQGESSRLYPLRKEGLVYSIWASNFTPLDKGAFEISCSLESSKIKEAKKAIQKEIERIKKSGVSAEELEKAQRQTLSGYLRSRQTSGDVASDNATNEAFLGDLDFSRKYVEDVKKLTPADIKRVANQYLVDSQMTVVVLKSKGDKEESPKAVQPSPESAIQKTVLENGLTVLLKEDHRLPLVSLRLALSGGLRAENDVNNGISNVLSDLWVKGTKSRSAKQIAEITAARGMGLNGFSGQNSIGLQAEFLSEDIDFAMDLFEDVLKNPVFPEDELQKDKEEIKSAIRSRDDNIISFTRLAFKETLFAKHPYRFDMLGTPETVDRFQRSDLNGFFKKLCVPNNMVLAVYGDIESKEILDVIKQKFGQLAKSEWTIPVVQEASPGEMRQTVKHLDKTQAVVVVGFQAPTMFDRDRYPFEVLTSIMGSPLSGRMFTKIRDELGQSYTLGGIYSPGIDTGYVMFYVSTTPQAVEGVKGVLFKQIEDLRNNFVLDQELEETKTYLKGTLKMGLEKNGDLAFTTALDELYGLGYDNYAKYSQAIDRVTKEDLLRVAKAYLSQEKAAVAVTRPKEPQPLDSAAGSGQSN